MQQIFGGVFIQQITVPLGKRKKKKKKNFPRALLAMMVDLSTRAQFQQNL